MKSDSTRDRVTALLADVRAGRDDAGAELLRIVYEELKALARTAFARERSGHTLQPTAIVNEAWLRVMGDLGEFEDRQHFFGVAARAMRQVLTDHARRHNSQKRGGGRARVTLETGLSEQSETPMGLVLLNDALNRLEEVNEKRARVAELRLFVGMSTDEAALALGMSKKVVAAEWRAARRWLRASLFD